jgi:hypothetical protein
MSYLDWNWSGEHVQAEIQNGEYLSSESTLVLAGPSNFTHLNSAGGLTSNAIVPLGLIQNISVSQNRQVQRIFEIGSKKAYFVPGKNFANFNIGRVMFFGPSLMRMLYALAPIDAQVGAGQGLGPFGQQIGKDPDDPTQEGITIPAAYRDLFAKSVLTNAPGFGGLPNQANRDFYINLASELFNVPFGMILVFKDTRNRPYGATYLEDCFIESHQFSVDANSVVIAEAVSGQFGSIVPVQLVTKP